MGAWTASVASHDAGRAAVDRIMSSCRSYQDFRAADLATSPGMGIQNPLLTARDFCVTGRYPDSAIRRDPEVTGPR